MSKDIRSYFLSSGSKNTKPKATETSPNDGQNKLVSKKRKQCIILDSDESSGDDDFVTTKKTKVSSADVTKAAKKNEEKKQDLKPVANVADILGSKPAKRSLLATLPQKEEPPKEKKPKKSKEKSKKPTTEAEVHSDDDFLLTCGDELLEIEKKGMAQLQEKKSPNKTNGNKGESPPTKTDSGSSKPKSTSPLRSNVSKETTPNKPSKAGTSHTPGSHSKSHKDEEVTPDALEKRKQHAAAYMKYIQRPGPANLHSKDLPEGVPNCLQGLTFVVTGVLDSIDRDEAAELIKGYGGKTTTTVSKNTSYVVAGTEPGPSKMEKASKLNTPVLDEDGLFDLIRTRQPFAATPSPSAGKVKGKRDKSPGKDKTPKQSEAKKPSSTPKDTDKIKKEEVETKVKKESPAKPVSPISPKAIKKESFYGGSSKPSPTQSSSSKTHSPASSSAGSSQASQSPVLREGHTVEADMWVDKYKPRAVKQIIGQQGDHSPANKLKYWLEHWATNNAPNAVKKPKPAPWAKSDDGAAFKAFNASDTRSKKLLHDEVREQMGCQTLVGFLSTKGQKTKALSQKRVLLMEEVDGVAGTQDRGGIPELIQLIKTSKIPVVCTCNDRNSQKLRSLANHCFDLRFPKPRLEQIRGAMMSLCFKEKIKIPPEALNSIIEGTNHDIRQVIHHLSLWSAGQHTMDQDLAKREASKAALFFHDYSFGPLFVQENYLSVVPHGASRGEGMPKERLTQRDVLKRVAEAADCIAIGDIVSTSIRTNNSWGLLPVQVKSSKIFNGFNLSDALIIISGSKEAVALDYLTPVRDKVLRHVVQEGQDGITASLETMEQYHLLREDLDNMNELCNWGTGQSDPWSKLPTQVKTAFTRAYNKANIMTPYTIAGAGVKGGRRKGGGGGDMEGLEGEEGEEGEMEEEEEDDEDLTADSMIKAKKPSASKASSVSKASGSGRGGGTGAKGAGSSRGGRGRGKK
ncbi:hypothetical protein B566_EDAN008529 [Ephemera danica]|nr:hypothetical protein B566_EDAN008529 [Ephemera danica]